MRVGLVCPYSFEVAGGVQFHVRDLAEHLLAAGHHVSVLAPADDETPLPPYVVAGGRALPVRYNGSVARLTFGPRTAARVSRWVEAGDFDLLHVHEPLVPSLSVLALWATQGPVVATFHTSLERSRALRAVHPLVRASVERIDGRVAVSQVARETVLTHIGGDAVVIPNGVEVARFADAVPDRRFVGTRARPVVCFVGRIDEPRKGLPVLLDALPALLDRVPGLRVVVAGHGDVEAACFQRPSKVIAACEFLGAVDEGQKAQLLAAADVFVAPHTGGESFGIVLVEAMAAGLPVLASDLPAFVQVLDDGRAGSFFGCGDPLALAAELGALLEDDDERRRLARVGAVRARRYDWSRVTGEVCAAYDTVLAARPAPAAPRPVRAAEQAGPARPERVRARRGGPRVAPRRGFRW